MNMSQLQRLRYCCRDEASFEEMKSLIAAESSQPGLAEFQLFLEKSDDVFVEYDRELRYVWINPIGAALLGLTPADVVGKTDIELIGDTAEQIQVLVQQAFETGQKVLVDQEIILPTGARIYNSIYAPIIDASGKVHRVVGLGRDVTELRRLQQESYAAILQAQNQAEQQRALFSIVARIRKSLDIDSIFAATVKEVRQLLNADRVGLFRFYPDSGWNDGEFIAEDVVPEYTSALQTKIHDHCFGEKYAAYYTKGRVQNVADIHAANLSGCHVSILSQFEIKANLVVPLLHQDELWGLMCIHQCSESRHWKEEEIEFVQQIVVQLGVALQQAELLAQTQQQAAQLKQTLQDLQQTQTQLIQTEKMSSLGQLVAGVAHEINNPVNFIYGNLSYVNTYTENLLKLVAAYQEEYISPSENLRSLIEEIDLPFVMKDFPKIVHSIEIGADRICRIVQSLRTFSRIDESDKKAVDIHEGIDSTLLILQHRFKSKDSHTGIQVIKNYGNLPLVDCYPSQLNQVFMNILSNAIDALEECTENWQKQLDSNIPTPTPTIHITTEVLDNTYALIKISDNGAGMNESVRSRIFDPFFTTKPVGRGTGLGLSISYQIIVDKHKGIFKCLSQPHQGTEFWIQVPIAALITKTDI